MRAVTQLLTPALLHAQAQGRDTVEVSCSCKL
ncbi:hypothetical protein OESDEN_03879 [Oesophagostomum dentatum]|uniref:Uncharacterized protein n=1 Tax=Oesophagostomum dentatum TaxID=61180 RepID=A0A0B1TF74_OESDE|nr:hypothetical protein OESDEN_03879 [Oesophagostomum dentatum]